MKQPKKSIIRLDAYTSRRFELRKLDERKIRRRDTYIISTITQLFYCLTEQSNFTKSEARNTFSRLSSFNNKSVDELVKIYLTDTLYLRTCTSVYIHNCFTALIYDN